jgi:hypothetical protein
MNNINCQYKSRAAAGSKRFFFGKKKQKTFYAGAAEWRCKVRRAVRAKSKSLLVLFFRKELP